MTEEQIRDLTRRLNEIEKRQDLMDKELAVLNAAVSLARWLGPLFVGIAAVLIGRA